MRILENYFHKFYSPHLAYIEKEYKIVIIVFSIIILFGCNKNKTSLHIDTFSINAEDVTTLNMEEFSSFSGIIPLETTPESVIGKIKKVFLTDSAIIIWDYQTKRILLFDREGKYKYNIGSRGPGPEEYVNIEDVYFDQDKRNILVSDASTKRVIAYDLKGKIVSSWQSDYFIYAFYPSSDGYWCINGQQNEMNCYLIHINEKDNKITQGYFRGRENKNNYLPYYVTNYFSKNDINNVILFHFPYNDTIYKIVAQKLEPFLFLDFGKRKNKKDIYSNAFQSTKYDGLIQNVHTFGDILFFSFVCYPNNELNLYHAYINLSEHVTKIFNFNINLSPELPVQPLPEILGLSQGNLIFQITPNAHETILKKLQSKIDNISIDSNPILVLYKLKK